MCKSVFCCCGDEHRRSSATVSPELLKKDSDSAISRDSASTTFPVKRCTDVFFLVLKIAFVIVLIILVAYSFSYGNIYRILNGYDDCGNVCGRLNEKDRNLGCKGSDKRNLKYLLVEKSENTQKPDDPYLHRQCVERCENVSGYRTFFNRCIPMKVNAQPVESLLSRTGMVSFFQEVSEDLTECWREMIYACIVAFVFSFIVLVMFRYVVGFIVWFVLLATVFASIFATIFLWIKWQQHRKDDDTEKTKLYLVTAIIATVATIIISLIILVMRKRVKLVIQLFKEAGTAINDMPMLLFEPLLTFLSLTVTISLWFYFALMIESSGQLTVLHFDSGASMKILYIKDAGILMARWINIFAFFWFSQFLIGCQHYVIAGSVSRWFFTRNKKKLGFPVLQSFTTLIRYHLGTICFGSLLIAIVQMMRVLLKGIQSLVNNPQNPVTTFLFNACQCCLACFENFIQYLTRNAYIIVAIDGDSFCPAGKRAFSLLASNALRVMAINSVGDFVLLLGKVFVVLVTVLVGIELIQNKPGLHHTSVPVILCGIFAYLMSNCFLTVFEMTVDTIFLCFCIDCEKNDGIEHPYYMSRGLMEFIQNSKTSLDVLSPSKKISKHNGWAGDGNYNINSVSGKMKP
ncbi:unnamed protein product [Diamesa serratosioi]